MAETVVPGLERRLKAHLLGEVNFDPFTRGRYATDASHYQIMPIGVVAPRSMKEAEHALALAREEGVSVLPRGAGTSQSGQTVNASLVDRLLEISRSCAGARRRRQALRGRARHRARRAQSPAAPARAVVSGRHLHRLARHHRRHGGQQFLRRAFAALRQHPRERAFDRCRAGGRRGRPFRSGRARSLRPAAPIAAGSAGARSPRARGARGRRDRTQFPQGAAPGRRLQSRRAGARPQRPQSRAHSRRLRGHARVLHPDRAQALAAARPARGRRLPFRQLRRGDGRPRSTSSSSGRSRSSWSIAPCWGSRARSRCSSPRSTRSCAAIPRRSCSSSSPRTTRARTCAAWGGSTR